MTLQKVAPGVVVELDNGMARFYTPVGSFLMSEGEAMKMSRSLIYVIEGESAQERASEEKMLETVMPEVPVGDQITDAVTSEPEATDVTEETEKKKRGRPRKNAAQMAKDNVIQQAAVEALSEMPRTVEIDAVVHLPGADVPVEVVVEANGEVVAAYANEDGTSGGVLVVPDDKVERVVDPFNAELHETLKKRFPVGARVRVFKVSETGAVTDDYEDGVLTKHHDGAHKCNVDFFNRVQVIDTQMIADAPFHDVDMEVVEKLQSGKFDVDYGKRWLGAPMLLLDDVVQAAHNLGADPKEARLTLASLASRDGFVNTQSAAVSIALYFASKNKEEAEADAPLTTDELSTLRNEVKSAGVTAAQAKDLCMRHFKKDSAALLTRSEMQKFLGEILPTWVEMQGAEDF